MPQRDNNHEMIAHIVIGELPEFTLEELSLACHTSPEFIRELIEYGTIEPEGFSPTTWRFEAMDIQITRKALRLHRDLEINSAGIALAMDLMQQMEQLRHRLTILEKHAQPLRIK